jgi:hypothetical protein
MQTDQLYKLTPQLSYFGDEFKILISDIDRQELPEIKNINDINKGSIHNALYWHIRSQQRAVLSCNLKNATDSLLKLWQKFLGFEKPYQMTDQEFAGWMIQSILSGSTSTTMVQVIFDGYEVRKAPNIPCYLDHLHLDCPNIHPTNPNFYKQSILSAYTDVIYVYMPNLTHYTDLMKGKIKAGYPAGIGLFIIEVA